MISRIMKVMVFVRESTCSFAWLPPPTLNKHFHSASSEGHIDVFVPHSTMVHLTSLLFSLPYPGTWQG
jgi:hypothetical protein